MECYVRTAPPVISLGLAEFLASADGITAMEELELQLQCTITIIDGRLYVNGSSPDYVEQALTKVWQDKDLDNAFMLAALHATCACVTQVDLTRAKAAAVKANRKQIMRRARLTELLIYEPNNVVVMAGTDDSVDAAAGAITDLLNEMFPIDETVVSSSTSPPPPPPPLPSSLPPQSEALSPTNTTALMPSLSPSDLSSSAQQQQQQQQMHLGS